MRVVAVLVLAAALLTGCHSSMDQECQSQYQNQYVLHGTQSDAGESAYVAQCLKDSGQ